MKVLIPVWGFGKAGGYRVLSKLADQLIKRNVEVYFICNEQSTSPYYPTIAKILWVKTNGEISKAPKGAGGNFFSHFLSLRNGLKAVCSKSNYDIIFANHNLTVYPAIFAGLKSKIVYYVQAYEPEYYLIHKRIKNYFLAFLGRLTYQFGLFTIVNADIYKKYKEIRSSRVLYPGIDFNFFHPNKIEKIKNDQIILGTVGRAEPYKGSSYIFEAFKQIRQEYDNVELHVAFGEQDFFSNCEGITCISPANDEELAKFYKNLNFYVCAGFLQLGAFHYPVAEAMSCKIPVVTTEYFPANKENVFLVSPKSSQNLIKSIKFAIENPLVARIKVERAFADIKVFTWENAGDLLYQFLLEKTSQK